MRGTKNKQLCAYQNYENLTDKKQLDKLIKILVHKRQHTKFKRAKLRINTELTALIKLCEHKISPCNLP